jgi:hypothetical protein
MVMKGWADISHIGEHAFYDFVMFRDGPATGYPNEKMTLGRWLGPSRDVGTLLTAHILKQNGDVVPRSTFRALTDEELTEPDHTERRRQFDEEIERRLGPGSTPDDFQDVAATPEFEYYEDDADLLAGAIGNFEGQIGSPDVPPEEIEPIELEPPTPELNDNYVGVDIMLPRGGVMTRGRVVRRKRDREGNLIGRTADNPINDTRRYEIEWLDDGDVTELTANVIAESMYAQCDPDGNQYVLLDCIVDWRKKEGALSIGDQVTVDSRGKRTVRRTTKGVELCCQWKDGSTSWNKLSDLKESHPLECAQYAFAQGIEHEPAFNWWAPHVLKKRKHIISLVRKRQTRYLKRTHKFGVEMPRNAEHAKELDAANGNTLWQDAIAKEMEKVRVAFKILEGGERAPIGHQFIKCHLIFDVKMENFQRKARFVAGGHMTEVPEAMTYASVVSRETVRLALTIAALNSLDVKVGDIENAYLTAPITEKIWTVLGAEFGADAGKKAIVVRALYGLKSAGAAFRKHLAGCMRDLGYVPCEADRDLWMKACVRPEDKFEYYSYILCYVDDIMILHHDADSIMARIGKAFTMKKGSVGDPDLYLGARIKPMVLDNGVVAWSMSASKYVQEAYKNCKDFIAKNDKFKGKYKVTAKPANPFPTTFDADTDVSEPLTPEEASYFQSIIGVLRWMIEIGRVDINVEVSILSSYQAYPREGHLHAAIHLMSFVGHKHNARLAFDPTYPSIDLNDFIEGEWKEFYGDVAEPMPAYMPKPLGKEVDVRAFVDSDHAGDKRTRRSRTGYLIYLNMALIDWFSKKQPTIETSVFGAEFVAMKNVVEKLRGLRYKLRMMGVPISGCSYVYGDNMSVIHNTQRPESTLKKKSNAICYHFVRESVAMGETLTCHIPTDRNLADLQTKVTYGQKRKRLVRGVLYDIYDYE